MPRGRKGPPKESIESILQTLSQREDIDPGTLSRYFLRLDKEWEQGAREKVLQLLHSRESSSHAAAVLVLAELASEDDLEQLEDLVTDPTVSDMSKLALSPILKELRSEMADDGIVEYLNDPASAMQQMQLRLLDLVGQSEMGIESILEDVVSMPLERRFAFISWLGSSNDPRAANLLIPLLESQPGKVAAAIIDALEQLGPVAMSQTVPALQQIVATSSSRVLKQQARAVLERLASYALPGEEALALQETLPSYQARVSFIDGSGSQLMMLSWQRPDGLLKGINILYQDRWGIRDCYSIDEMEKRRWEELVSDLNKQGFGSFQLPFEQVCAMAKEARALNKRTRHKVPVSYLIWRPLIESRQVSNVEAVIGPRPADQGMLELAQHGAELYQMVEFLSWMYEPIEKIEPYITRYWAATYALLESSSGGRRSRSQKSKQTEKVQKVLMESLIDEAIGQLIDTEWRALYEARLRRQATILSNVGRRRDADLVCAVAAVLHPSSTVPLKEQAFPRALIKLSIEQGPLRMMVESLESGRMSGAPINLFEDDR